LNLDPSAFHADQELIEALERHSIEISCGGEYKLFRQGDSPLGLFILNKGEVALSMTTADGEEFISFEVTNGALLGLPALISNQPYTLTALARDGASLSFVSREDFEAVVKSDPRLSLKVLQVLAAEVRTARTASMAS
jgi:CRP/FNR family transcriptional regulator, cyclic AMP receptor protein